MTLGSWAEIRAEEVVVAVPRMNEFSPNGIVASPPLAEVTLGSFQRTGHLG